MDERMDRWMDEWVDEWMDGQMDRWNERQKNQVLQFFMKSIEQMHSLSGNDSRLINYRPLLLTQSRLAGRYENIYNTLIFLVKLQGNEDKTVKDLNIFVHDSVTEN